MAASELVEFVAKAAEAIATGKPAAPWLAKALLQEARGNFFHQHIADVRNAHQHCWPTALILARLR